MIFTTLNELLSSTDSLSTLKESDDYKDMIMALKDVEMTSPCSKEDLLEKLEDAFGPL